MSCGRWSVTHTACVLGQRLELQGVAATSVCLGRCGPAGPQEAKEGCFPGFPGPGGFCSQGH